MDKSYYVYIHTNKINGKQYVGMTKLKPNERWENGNGYRRQKHFYKDIQKYGWDAFEHEIVKEGLSKEEAKQLESELIKKSNTNNDGYNRQCALYDENGNPIYGYQKKQIEQAELNLKNTKLLYCVELNRTFKNAVEAGKETNTDFSSIYKVCAGKRKSAGKHPVTGERLHWKYIFF